MSKQYLMGEVKAVDDGSKHGAFEVILSAPTLDRDGEVVESRVFEPLPDHITFDIDHGMSVATTVGSGRPEYTEDGLLKVVGTYSSIPRAQEVRTLVKEGHIRTTSVAFMNAVREEKDGVPHVVSAELLNGAFVPIPSNRESVVLSAKAYREAIAPSTERLFPGAWRSRKGWGMSANDLGAAVSDAVRGAHGAGADEDVWVWVRDWSDEWVVFQIETETSAKLYQQGYTVEERKASLVGEPSEVRARTVYDPLSTESNAPAPVTADPGSPASAKSPERVRVAKARALVMRAGLPVIH